MFHQASFPSFHVYISQKPIRERVLLESITTKARRIAEFLVAALLTRLTVAPENLTPIPNCATPKQNLDRPGICQ